MKALLIEFDLSTGKRAGNISPHDRGLPCRGWQNLETTPALEIRLIADDRDVSQYEGITGVTILDGKEAINQAIQADIPSQYKVVSETILIEAMKEKRIPLSEVAGKRMDKIAKFAIENSLAGALERKPRLLE